MPLDVASIQQTVGAVIPSVGLSATRIRSGSANASVTVLRNPEIERDDIPESILDYCVEIIRPKSEELPVAGDRYQFALDATDYEVIEVTETAAGHVALSIPSQPIQLRRADTDAPFTGAPDSPAVTFVSARALMIPGGGSMSGRFGDTVSSRPRAILRPGWLSASQQAEILRMSEAAWQVWALVDGTAPTSGDANSDQARLLDYAIPTPPQLHRSNSGAPLLLDIPLSGGGA